MVDNFARECLAILVTFSITARDVVALLEDGLPSMTRRRSSERTNGPEFIASDVQQWLAQAAIATDYIEPGSP